MMRKLMGLMCLSALVCGCGGDGGSSGGEETKAPASVSDHTGPVVFMGDSITHGWPLPTSYVDTGISGETSVAMLARFQTAVISLQPSVVHILAGTNDVWQIPGATIDSVAEMAQEAAAAGACVIIGTIPPDSYLWTLQAAADLPVFITTQAQMNEIIAKWNADIELLAQTYGYRLANYHALFVDAEGNQIESLFSDGAHPNDQGYTLMDGVVQPLIADCQEGI
jgi:lysophospholipase L1-like esterase